MGTQRWAQADAARNTKSRFLFPARSRTKSHTTPSLPQAAYDISEHDTLIFGAYGLLVAGPNSRHHEPLLCAYLQFITIDIFLQVRSGPCASTAHAHTQILTQLHTHSHRPSFPPLPLPLQNFFARIWILNDDLVTTNKIIETGEKDPRALNRIRYRICRLAKDIIQLEEILGYMLEALEVIEIPPEPPEQAGRSLYERLEISGMRNQLLRRAVDLKKNIAGTIRFLDVLREMSSVVSESKMFLLNESVDLNTKRMCLLQDSNERTAGSLMNLQMIFGGILAFDILDRLTGQWSVANSPWFSAFYTSAIQSTPLLWFILSMFVWLVVCGVILQVRPAPSASPSVSRSLSLSLLLHPPSPSELPVRPLHQAGADDGAPQDQPQDLRRQAAGACAGPFVCRRPLGPARPTSFS